MSNIILRLCLRKRTTLLCRKAQTRSMSTQDAAIKYLNQSEAIALDQELFNEYAFSVDQLMELAGLSCAQVVAKCYPVKSHPRPIIFAGPGNNGGDGLVCARHLKMFGYSPIVLCPKPGRSQLYQNLIKQCQSFQVVVEQGAGLTDKLETLMAGCDLQIDAIFGFSFKPPNRNETIARLLQEMHTNSVRMPIVSIDIPSGWHVEMGCSKLTDWQHDLDESLKIPALQPDCLVSLTAPKLCAKDFTGRHHYLGGRFVPDSIEQKYQLNLPAYPGTEGIFDLKGRLNS